MPRIRLSITSALRTVTGRAGRILAVALALTAAAPAGAAAAQASADTEVLVIGVENILYLPAYGVQDGAYAGYARDLFDAFAADAGYTVEYRALPVARLYASLAAGAVDLKFPDNPRWRPDFREGRTIHYSAPVLAYLDATLVWAERADAVTPDDIRRLGTVTGFTPWPWLDRIESGAVTVTENSSFESLVLQALAGRVDGAYANIAGVNRVLTEVLDRPGVLAFAPALPHDRGSYRASTIDHPEIIAALDAWMAVNADRLAALKARHGAERGVGSQE
ncbi:transporter substrate-binding domain-containing protein [Roseospira goensis]|uniref:ABC-type amino acid transport substrate-binding protein n=1 Tax=Roseospira goensis TaxID=391922 RepID=A0A7W6RZV3_9PROT|nr:ABC-type amino acid transport substrate-binding protein [Roseospira goensis]